MYCCGPTVYDYQHIGNMRTYIFEDILRRTLEYNKFKVDHIMNITDVGHLTSDADEGEDKMMKALKREGLKPTKESMLKLANKYTKTFKEELKALNLLPPTIWCKATEHIPEMIKLIKKIEANGYTYKTNVGLIYNTSKYKDYAKLGKLNLKEIKAGARVKIDPERKNPSDFTLWVTNQPKHIMQWDSPWGKGFPGWHIECSAMSMKYLGKQFDIHCGGIDHIQVHHTNEIAQAEAATGKKWVNYWLHSEFLIKDKKRMAKSAGEFLRLNFLTKKGFHPLDYKFLCLGAHYRTQLNFSLESLKSAKDSFNKLKEKIIEMKENPTSKKNEKLEKKYKEKFLNKINDDLNMPEALAVVWAVVKEKGLGNREKYKLLLNFDKVLGLDLKNIKKEKIKIPAEITALAKKRLKARKNKDWATSDKLRDQIGKKGYLIEDTANSFSLKKK